MYKSVLNADKGEGAKKSENFADVIDGSSLKALPRPKSMGCARLRGGGGRRIITRMTVLVSVRSAGSVTTPPRLPIVCGRVSVGGWHNVHPTARAYFRFGDIGNYVGVS